MIIVVIILGVLLAVAAAIIFCLYRVLKNTFSMTEELLNIVEGKQLPQSLHKAYNGVYYPATIIAKINFDAKWEGQVTDFSMYDKYKIVGLTIMTKESAAQYYGMDIVSELEEIGEEALAALNEPVIMKNKLVFEISEGVWAWKSPD
jgi:hypothetical protein